MKFSRIAFALALALGARRALAQNTVLDLRLFELDRDGRVQYQNFIYARSLADGRLVAQATYLRLGNGDYNEVAIAPGLRVAHIRDVSVYGLAGIANATDGWYAEPAILVQDLTGRLTGALYVQRYIALEDKGVDQWLVDSFEAQYVVRGPLYLGAAFYAFRPDGGTWLTKIGPRVGLNDKRGSTEIRVTRVSVGGAQFQLRRIVVF